MFEIRHGARPEGVHGILILAAALAVILSLSTSAQAAGGPWTVASVEGAAKMVTGGGVAEAIVPGRPVTVGATVATGADGKVVLARRGDSITVFPNSKMAIPAASGTDEPGVLQSLGRLLFHMESRESRDFEVETPYLAAAIKGTTFAVSVNGDAATVDVSEGLVQVTANGGGGPAFVGPGQRATVDRDGADTVQVAGSGDDDKGDDPALETDDGTAANDSDDNHDDRGGPDGPESSDGGVSGETGSGPSSGSGE